MANSDGSSTVIENVETDDGSNQDMDWALARKGINLIVNNKHEEAEALFLEHPNSLVMYSGYSFAVFLDALMTFEEEKLSKAILVLKEVEKRCTSDNGWLKSFSSFFGNAPENTQTLAEELETQIILADSQVCMAALTFFQQDLSGYFRGGWVLRKAWKVYQKAYKDILTLYREKVGELQLPDPILTTPTSNLDQPSDMDLASPSSEWNLPETQINGYSYHSKTSIPHSRSSNFPQGIKANLVVGTDDVLVTKKSFNNSKKLKLPRNLGLKKSSSVTEALSARSRNNSLSSTRFSFRPLTASLSFNSFAASLNQIFPGNHFYNKESQIIDKETLIRLMGAISFGYGLFQLGISLLPPSLNRLVSLLGFAANRQNGISCLMYSRLGKDMRAPLASMSLLWYHTIVRPFYAIDGTNVQAGVETASVLIQESKKEFEDSALFLFFSGRMSRLDSDIPTALKSFQKANENANHREIKILCLHEIGWCHLIQLNYSDAKGTFIYLKCTGRWSRAFYGYLTSICIGAAQDFRGYTVFDDLQSNVSTSRGGQLEDFLRRRMSCSPQSADDAKKHPSIYFKLLVFEMLYLWNALASCSKENIDEIITDCKSVHEPTEEPRNGLANLILGSCYAIQKNYTAAIDSFKICLEKRINELCNSDDAHISAFAQHELGHLLLRKEETKEEGKLLLQQICKYNHYDFEAKLNVRIHNTLKQL